MSAPFLVLGLPRSRSYWLSKFLSYGHCTCGHDQARFIRSVEDVKSLLSVDYTGSVETAAAPWWRLARHYRPDLKIAVIRRDRYEVIESLMRFGYFDRTKLIKAIDRQDRALDSAGKAPDAISICYEDLATQAACARLFEHCLETPFNLAYWMEFAGQNLQINLRAQLAYFQANQRQIGAAAKSCAKAQRYVCLRRQANSQPDPDGIVIQEEDYATWLRDAQALLAAHCQAIGLTADAAQHMNLPLWDQVTRAGVAQIMTARLNGRMLGYLTAVLVPSFEAQHTVCTQVSLFVSADAAGMRLGQRLQRACVVRARERGAKRMQMRAGVRADGPRLGALYKRMGAESLGTLYELDISA